MDTTIEQQKAMEAQAIAVSRETRISAEQSAEAFSSSICWFKC